MNFAPGDRSERRPQDADWNRIANSAPFRRLLAAKKAFIMPAFLFFLAYYLSLPILLGYAPRLMSTKVAGAVTVAYLFALSQFVVGWTIACLYVKSSSRFDRLVDDVLRQDLREEEPAKREK